MHKERRSGAVSSPEINNENGKTFYILGYFSNEIFRCQSCDEETTAAIHYGRDEAKCWFMKP